MTDLRGVLNLVKFQSWDHLFESLMPQLHEKYLRIFYHNLIIFDDGLYVMSQVNGVDID